MVTIFTRKIVLLYCTNYLYIMRLGESFLFAKNQINFLSRDVCFFTRLMSIIVTMASKQTQTWRNVYFLREQVPCLQNTINIPFSFKVLT